MKTLHIEVVVDDDAATVDDLVVRVRGASGSGVQSVRPHIFLMDGNLNYLRDACHANARNKGFHGGDHVQPVAEGLMLMVSELSEALEDHRDGHLPNHMWYEEKFDDARTCSVGTRRVIHPDSNGVLNKPCGVPSEIADVIIRAMDFSGLHGIDIVRAVREKMAFNATRPRLHGKTF